MDPDSDIQSMSGSSSSSGSFDSRFQKHNKKVEPILIVQLTRIQKMEEENMQESEMQEENMHETKSNTDSIQSFTEKSQFSINSFKKSQFRKDFQKLGVRSKCSQSSHSGSDYSREKKGKFEKLREEQLQIAYQTYIKNVQAQKGQTQMDIQENEQGSNQQSCQNNSSKNSFESFTPNSSSITSSIKNSDQFVYDKQTVQKAFIKKNNNAVYQSQFEQDFIGQNGDQFGFDKRSIRTNFPRKGYQKDSNANFEGEKKNHETEKSTNDNLSTGGSVRYKSVRHRPITTKGAIKIMTGQNPSDWFDLYEQQLQTDDIYSKLKSQFTKNNEQLWNVIKRSKLKQALKYFITSKRLRLEQEYNLQTYQRIRNAVNNMRYFMEEHQFIELENSTLSLYLAYNGGKNDIPFDEIQTRWNTFLFTSIVALSTIQTQFLEKVIKLAKKKTSYGEAQHFQNLKQITLTVSPQIWDQMIENYPRVDLQILSEIGDKFQSLYLRGSQMEQAVLESLLKARLTNVKNVHFKFAELTDINILKRILEEKVNCFPKARITFQYFEDYCQENITKQQIDQFLMDQKWKNLLHDVQIIALDETEYDHEFHAMFVKQRNDKFQLFIDEFESDQSPLQAQVQNALMQNSMNENQKVVQITKQLFRKLQSQALSQILDFFFNKVNLIYLQTQELSQQHSFVEVDDSVFHFRANTPSIMQQKISKLDLQSWNRILFFKMTLHYDIEKIQFILNSIWRNLEDLTLCGIQENQYDKNHMYFGFLVKKGLNHQLTALRLYGKKLTKSMIIELLIIDFSKLKYLQFSFSQLISEEVIDKILQFKFKQLRPDCQILIRLPQKTGQEFKEKFAEMNQRIIFANDFEVKVSLILEQY